MYAIVEVGGRQHMMQPDQTVKVDRRPQEAGEQITLDKVLAIKGDDGELRVGRPYLEDATVTARVVEQGRERKITVVKFKAKKRYRRKVGHRQHFTALEVLSIDADWIEARPEPEPEAEEQEVEAAEEAPETEAPEVEAATETEDTGAETEDTGSESEDNSSETGDDTDGS
ncbi:MAG: 50S ribosomal protein L21 [Armatimonadota bacterium]